MIKPSPEMDNKDALDILNGSAVGIHHDPQKTLECILKGWMQGYSRGYLDEKCYLMMTYLVKKITPETLNLELIPTILAAIESENIDYPTDSLVKLLKSASIDVSKYENSDSDDDQGLLSIQFPK